MIIEERSLVIIGAGPAGLAAAVKAKKKGMEDVLLLERDNQLGGILKQCIHNGFGLHIFKEELTGPEFALRYIRKISEMGIEYKLDTMVISIDENKNITTVNPQDGLRIYKAGAIILAMGCRERPRGALRIPGTNPSGIFSAGTAQRFVNIEGMKPGKTAVILGSGDIGLIMARRMTLEGMKVKAVCEIMPHPGGLTRNIVQCLEDFDIPLKLSHTVTQIHGRTRLEGVTISRVDENYRPIEGTEQYIKCDTLLLSVGLIPENELAEEAGVLLDPATKGALVNQHLETSVDGIYACGNVLHVHDLVDYVALEAERAAESAVRRLKGKSESGTKRISVIPGNGVRYTVPQFIDKGSKDEKIKIYFRSGSILKSVRVNAVCKGKTIYSKKFKRLVPAEMEYIKIPTEDLKGSKVLIEAVEK
ncbi:MAG TPA: FAD-dependent oxidoreductase [Clostridia bacterium]|nr:FAD-dependent oxidoreductase [Clostridia bacterium]